MRNIINDVLKKIAGWFLSRYEFAEINIKKRAEIFFWIIFLVSVVWFIFSFVFMALFEVRLIFKLVLLVIEIQLILTLVIFKKGHYKASYLFYLVSFLTTFTVFVFFIQSDYSIEAAFWIAQILCVILVTYSLISIKRNILVYIALYCIAILISISLYRIYVFPKYAVEYSHIETISFSLIFTLFFCILSYIANKITNQIISEISMERNLLEHKIIERTGELKKAKDEIEKLSEQKTNFFINLAHETKTPLTLINNYLDKLITGTGCSNDLLIIKRNMEKITRDMINFFEIEKTNKGKIIYDNIETVNFSDFLKDKLVFFNDAALKKKISIKSDISGDICLNIDPTALDRLINNLLDNSLKFTEVNGHIGVILSINDDIGEFIVTDDGIGISKEDLDHIFETYYQIGSVKKNSQGIGLGLSIVKNIAAQFDMKIRIESEINAGTKFIINFKPEIPEKNISSKKYKYTGPQDFPLSIKENDHYVIGRANILIIEDNIDLLNFLCERIAQEYNVFPAINGKEAIEKLTVIPKPDMILSDIMMDEMDGYDFYRDLRKNPAFKDIPLIFLTARMNIEDKLYGLSFGAVDYITKPFEISVLTAKIKSLLNIKKANIEKIKDSISDYLYGLSAHNDNLHNNTLEVKCSKYKISDKEKEVLSMLLKGYEYKEIGENLGLSINTVRTHIKKIYDKCSVNSKYSLMNIFR